MTTPNGLDRRLTDWLLDQAPTTAPDALLVEVRARAAVTRRRPAWATSERWISMETRARFGAVPRVGVLLAVLLSLLILATAIAFAAGTSPAPKRPPPYGPAANGLIAYGYLGDVWLIGEDGSDPQQLTSGPELDFTGVWSPDGTTLAYWSAEFDGDPTNAALVEATGSRGDLSLRVIRPGETEPRILVSGLSESGFGGTDIAWSPDSTRIAYAHRVVGEGGVAPQIDIVTVAEGKSTPLVRPGYTPSWSPDGETIAYASDRYFTDPDGAVAAGSGIFLVDAAGGEPRPLTRVRGDDWSFLNPQWSNDGHRVLFHAGTNFVDDIFIAQTDGTGETQVTSNTDTERFPVWSPDDSRIAYYRAGPSDGSRLVASDPDGANEVTFDHTRTAYRPPRWSPDLTRVVGITASAAGNWTGIAILDVTDETLPVLIPIERVDGLTGDLAWQRVAP